MAYSFFNVREKEMRQIWPCFKGVQFLHVTCYIIFSALMVSLLLTCIPSLRLTPMEMSSVSQRHFNFSLRHIFCSFIQYPSC